MALSWVKVAGLCLPGRFSEDRRSSVVTEAFVPVLKHCVSSETMENHSLD